MNRVLKKEPEKQFLKILTRMGENALTNSRKMTVKDTAIVDHPVPPTLDSDTLSRIFSAQAPYSNSDEENLCLSLADALTDRERESAARTSFAYWAASTSPSDDDETTGLRPAVDNSVRRRMAARMVRRHMAQGRLAKCDPGACLEDVRSCLRFRERRDLDSLRLCFFRRGGDSGGHGSKTTNDEVELEPHSVPLSLLLEYESQIAKDLSTQPMAVCGMDPDRRAIVVKCSRTTSECDEEAYVLSHLYTAERAIAATEWASGGVEEKVVAMMDFADYGEGHRPPIQAIRRLIGEMQAVYPERLEKMLVLNPPFWMRALFGVVRVFLDKDVRNKVELVSGEKQIAQALGSLSFDLTDDMDIDRYLRDVPFFLSNRDVK